MFQFMPMGVTRRYQNTGFRVFFFWFLIVRMFACSHVRWFNCLIAQLFFQLRYLFLGISVPIIPDF